ncbi:hypothetical protein TNCV_1793351 [Trichonephila clavipes]|nr:hypothetical protein TNCV_1793351 [Trichonephila clavipes]
MEIKASFQRTPSFRSDPLAANSTLDDRIRLKFKKEIFIQSVDIYSDAESREEKARHGGGFKWITLEKHLLLVNSLIISRSVNENRLLDSLKGRTGENKVSQADTDRFLCLAVWSTNLNLKNLCLDDMFPVYHELQHLQKMVLLALSSQRRSTTVAQLVAIHSNVSGVAGVA